MILAACLLALFLAGNPAAPPDTSNGVLTLRCQQPMTTNRTLRVTAPTGCTGSLRLYDLSGRLIGTTGLRTEQEAPTVWRLDEFALRSGIYVLVAETTCSRRAWLILLIR